MCKLLNDWTPSKAAIDMLKLNGVDDNQIALSVKYLKDQSDLVNIDDVKGYDNWNSLFIMFCIKANKKTDS